jgi:hypothetical protein
MNMQISLPVFLKIGEKRKFNHNGKLKTFIVKKRQPLKNGNYRYTMQLVGPKNPVRKPAKKRLPNPVPKSRRAKVLDAIQLYQRFRGTDPKYVDEVETPKIDVAMLIGQCDGILYTTVRDGKKEQYIHEFTGKSCPSLIASWDGKQIALIGGNYNFTDEGITDNG